MVVRGLCFVLLALITLAHPSGVQAAGCDSGDDCPCMPPQTPAQQSIDLGRYRGVVGLYYQGPFKPGQRAGVRLECAGPGRCVCAFPADFQLRDVDPDSGLYRFDFTGSSPIYPFADTSVFFGATADGRLLMDPFNVLRPYLSLRGRQIRLSPSALRPVRIQLLDAPAQWGVDPWTLRPPVTAKSSWTPFIVGVTYFLTFTSGGANGGALFVVNERGQVILRPQMGPVALSSPETNTIDIGGH